MNAGDALAAQLQQHLGVQLQQHQGVQLQL